MHQASDDIDTALLKDVLRYGALVVTLSFFIGCDQLTKEYARRELSFAPISSRAIGVLHFEYAENPGSFMSLGAGLPEDYRRWIHITSAFIVLVGFGLLFAYAYRLDRIRLLGFSLLLAGACGNLVDRFYNDGRVIDFIVLRFGDLQTGVFNLADVFILTGLGVVLLRMKSPNRTES
jgi:signal peptidase II